MVTGTRLAALHHPPPAALLSLVVAPHVTALVVAVLALAVIVGVAIGDRLRHPAHE